LVFKGWELNLPHLLNIIIALRMNMEGAKRKKELDRLTKKLNSQKTRTTGLPRPKKKQEKYRKAEGKKKRKSKR